MTVISERLQKLRKSAGETQDELASKLKLSIRSIQHYEVGSRVPQMDQVQRLADHFNVSVDYLVGRTDDPTPPTPPDKSQESAE